MRGLMGTQNSSPPLATTTNVVESLKIQACVLFWFVALALFFAQSQVEAATLNKKKVELSVGKIATLTLKNANGTVKWTSGNSKICKVKNGRLTAVAPGKITIVVVGEADNGES